MCISQRQNCHSCECRSPANRELIGALDPRPRSGRGQTPRGDDVCFKFETCTYRQLLSSPFKKYVKLIAVITSLSEIASLNHKKKDGLIAALFA